MKGSIQMVFQKAGLEIYNYDSTHCIYYELIETIPQVSNLIYSRSLSVLGYTFSNRHSYWNFLAWRM
jgi:hypothetical protein